MFNYCLCGSAAGYPHKLLCPYPLYQATEKETEEWQKAMKKKKLDTPTPLPEIGIFG